MFTYLRLIFMRISDLRHRTVHLRPQKKSSDDWLQMRSLHWSELAQVLSEQRKRLREGKFHGSGNYRVDYLGALMGRVKGLKVGNGIYWSADNWSIPQTIVCESTYKHECEDKSLVLGWITPKTSFGKRGYHLLVIPEERNTCVGLMLDSRKEFCGKMRLLIDEDSGVREELSKWVLSN